MKMLISFSIIFYIAGSVYSQDLPEQFRIWGKTAKEHPYLISPKYIPENHSEITEYTNDEKERGFVVFSKPLSAVIAPDYIPTIADRCNSLTAQDCPGQYGAITFSVFTLRNASLSMKASALKGPNGNIIGAENMNIRALRYIQIGEKITPLLLESFDNINISERNTQQFWITYYIPENTNPGEYQGNIGVFIDGKESLKLPVSLHVHTYKLIEPNIHFYIYSSSPEQSTTLLNDLLDQSCHGMNISTLDMPVTRDGELKVESLKLMLDIYRQVGFDQPYFYTMLANRVTCEWLNTQDKSINMWGPWFRYYPFSDDLDKKYVDMVRTILSESRKLGIEPILEVADEAGSHPWTIEATQHYNALIKKEVPEVLRELTTGGGWATGQPEHDLWKGLINIWSTNRWLPDKLAIVRKDDPQARIQLYNMGGGGSQAGGIQASRLFYGFFAWKAKSEGIAQWVYYHDSTPEHNYVWQSQDQNSKVPTLRWELVREGTKDYRYIAMLEKLLDGNQSRVANEARRFLEDISSQIELRNVDYDPISGGRIPAHPSGTYEMWRTHIADYIEALIAEKR